MSDVGALRAALIAGASMYEGTDLALEADAPPSTEILELLDLHKPGIVALL
jgi:hypothetical protein